MFKFLFALALMLWKGFLWLTFWGWFVVPLGAPEISYPLAMGLSLFVAYSAKYVKLDKEVTIEQLVDSFVFDLSAFIIGWIIRFFL